MGGSDQWGNIVNGIDLGRRMGTPQLYALTAPLLTTSSGAKMGKTAAGAIWLNEDMLGPYEYWQFWRNTEDADVGRFLKLFTTLPMDEIARLAALQGRRSTRPRRCWPMPQPRSCTARRQPQTPPKPRARHSKKVPAPKACPRSRPISLAGSAFSPPCVAGFATSNGEARRAIQGGAVRVNDVPVNGRQADADRGDLKRRRDQAVHGQEEARAPQAGLVVGRCFPHRLEVVAAGRTGALVGKHFAQDAGSENRKRIDLRLGI